MHVAETRCWLSCSILIEGVLSLVCLNENIVVPREAKFFCFDSEFVHLPVVIQTHPTKSEQCAMRIPFIVNDRMVSVCTKHVAYIVTLRHNLFDRRWCAHQIIHKFYFVIVNYFCRFQNVRYSSTGSLPVYQASSNNSHVWGIHWAQIQHPLYKL